MKKLSAALVIAVLVVAMSGLSVRANQDVRVVLDGRELSFDVPPAVRDGRTLVPLRAIFEALGATVGYEPATQTITAVRDTTVIVLRVGETRAQVNEEPVMLDVPSQVVNGRTLVPLRFVSEALGAQVGWDGETRTVSINTVYVLTILPPRGEGAVDPSPGSYELVEGARQKVAASPAPGWRLRYWLIDGRPGPESPLLEGIVEQDWKVQPVFEEIIYQLTILAPQGQGTVDPPPGMYEGKARSEMTATAKPAPGWRLSHWVIDEDIGPDTAHMSLDLNGDRSAWPVFERLWGSMTGGRGVDADITADAFRVFIAADAAAESDKGPFGATFHGLRPLRGNFDIQVPFELAEWPQENGVRVFLGAADFQVERVSFGPSGDFPGHPRNVVLVSSHGVHAITPVDDTSGKLRIRRQGSKLTGYYGAGDRWIPLHTADVSADDVQIRLGAFSNNTLFTGQAVRVNFEIPELME